MIRNLLLIRKQDNCKNHAYSKSYVFFIALSFFHFLRCVSLIWLKEKFLLLINSSFSIYFFHFIKLFFSFLLIFIFLDKNIFFSIRTNFRPKISKMVFFLISKTIFLKNKIKIKIFIYTDSLFCCSITRLVFFRLKFWLRKILYC